MWCWTGEPEDVRRLLLRTSVLERVSGPLADALAGAWRERVLQELEVANAFVVSLDAGRSWFRYHHLFADLLQLELRRTAPGEVTGLHQVAAQWFAEHGFAVEAIRHAQAARTGGWPPACSPGTGPACIWAGRPRRCTRSWPGSRRGPRRRMLSWRRWRRPMSWRRDRWRPRSGIWRWRTGGGVGAGGPARAGAGAARDHPAAAARQRGNLRAMAEEARKLQATAEAPEAAARPGRGAARAGAGQPRQRQVRGGPARGGSGAPGAGGGAGPPGRAALP